LSADCLIEIQEQHKLDIFDVVFIATKLVGLSAVSVFLFKGRKRAIQLTHD
jgi:hypothetical protein